MISREEYNKALDIVEAYHKQLFIGSVGSSLNQKEKTLIRTWDKFYDCPNHLQSILENIRERDESGNITRVEYLEDVTRNIFRQQRRGGEKTWQIFKEIRGY